MVGDGDSDQRWTAEAVTSTVGGGGWSEGMVYIGKG